ncbi:ABC transporter substrate-binding protein [Pseudonocardia sp. MH-G8]|uniref:ABC transporter substrate-binding protein n=1 Tax=Pseudonocardia sp. MH-G8 TaxID=1854588 RepID=UPI000BA0701A|nr:ABC transporter substrate-binding protein [Pseudonocardia sp. MH-G8]OZM82012.1 glycine/betaine ABC transporter substrate-binding protein [Pseudonocardia sp. MH-G8]
MTRTSTLLAGAAAGILLLSACGGSDPLAPGGGGQAPAPSDTIRITSADFPENRVLAEIYAQTLEKRGVSVERDFGVGAREVYFPGLTDGSWDLVPDYTGVLLQFVNPDAAETEPDAVYSALQGQVPEPLTVLDRSEAENKDAIVVTAETAQQYGTSLADYGPICGELVFGGPPEFETRPDGLPGIAESYGCTFKEFRPLDTGGPLTVAALADGTVQAADLFTTDPAIEERGFVALEDPQNNFAAQNVVPLINESKATPEVVEALNAVSAALTTEGLVELNRELNSPEKPNVDVVAKGWLDANGL